MFLFAAALFVLPSCSDNDDDNNSLNGTTWVFSKTFYYSSFSETFAFGENTITATWVGIYGENESSGTYSGTYSYDHPKVTIIFTLEDHEYGPKTWTVIGTISDNKLHLDNGDIY